MLLNKFVDPQLNLNFIITVKNSLETLTLTLSIIKYSKSKLSRDWNFVILTLRRKKLKVSVYIIFWIIFVKYVTGVCGRWVSGVCSGVLPPLSSGTQIQDTSVVSCDSGSVTTMFPELVSPPSSQSCLNFHQKHVAIMWWSFNILFNL